MSNRIVKNFFCDRLRLLLSVPETSAQTLIILSTYKRVRSTEVSNSW
ncbi:hypothetical protein [Nostoc sp.]